MMVDFREVMDTCGLKMILYTGYKFTWNNRREGGKNVQELSDKGFINTSGLDLFPHAVCNHLLTSISDHQGILLNFAGIQLSKQGIFILKKSGLKKMIVLK